MPETIAYPLLFTFTDQISGQGFVAGIQGLGRALMVREDDGAWWMYGVEPGALAASGESPREAHLSFIEAFKGVLLEIARDRKDFDSFKTGAEKFFSEVCDPNVEQWAQLAAAIRSGKLVPDAPFSDLQKVPAEARCGITVQRMQDPSIQAVVTTNQLSAAA